MQRGTRFLYTMVYHLYLHEPLMSSIISRSLKFFVYETGDALAPLWRVQSATETLSRQCLVFTSWRTKQRVSVKQSCRSHNWQEGMVGPCFERTCLIMQGTSFRLVHYLVSGKGAALLNKDGSVLFGLSRLLCSPTKIFPSRSQCPTFFLTALTIT